MESHVYEREISKESIDEALSGFEGVEILPKGVSGRNKACFFAGVLRFGGEEVPKKQLFRLVIGERKDYRGYHRYLNDILQPLENNDLIVQTTCMDAGKEKKCFKLNPSIENDFLQSFLTFHGIKPTIGNLKKFNFMLNQLGKLLVADLQPEGIKAHVENSREAVYGLLFRLYYEPYFAGVRHFHPKRIEDFIKESDEGFIRSEFDVTQEEWDCLMDSKIDIFTRVNHEGYMEHLRRMDVEDDEISMTSGQSFSAKLVKWKLSDEINQKEFLPVLRKALEEIKEKKKPTKIILHDEFSLSSSIKNSIPLNLDPR